MYLIYDDFCSYTVLEWSAVNTLVTTGTDLDPYWADPSLAQDERLGAGSESYTIFFEADGETYIYETEDYYIFNQAAPGSRWNLEVNSVGGIQSISP